MVNRRVRWETLKQTPHFLEKCPSCVHLKNVWKHKQVLARTHDTHGDRNNRVTPTFSPNQSQVLVDCSLLKISNDVKIGLQAEKRVTRYVKAFGKLWI